MHTRTKIVCTMGPAVAGIDKILELIDAGMNVARLNFSHGTHKEHLKTIQELKEAREIRGVPLAIMLDTKGPEIRLGTLKKEGVSVETGDQILLVKEAIEGDEKRLPIHPAIAIDALEVGMRVLFDDGYIMGKVIAVKPEGVLVELQNSGVLKTHKGVNIPEAYIDLPAMTEQDKADIAFGCRHEIDLIAASFIRSADHVMEIKHLLNELGQPHILVLAKIENRLGLENFDRIVQVADGILVARGDLGVELPLKQVPVWQKMMIRKCNAMCKPVITATQMLESMTKNPRPTRAEVSDVANAIYDSTSGVMLSGETAVGLYPVETVAMMRGIIEEAEKDFDYRAFFMHEEKDASHDVSMSVSLSSVKTAYGIGAKAIFAFTNSGFTARLISCHRPEIPIFALTPEKSTYHQLAIHWGVIPVNPVACKNVREAFMACSRFALSRSWVQCGDLVIVTAGAPFGVSGTTNMMIVESIGDVLVRGCPGFGSLTHGEVALIFISSEENQEHSRGKFVVLTRCHANALPFLEGSRGIILQNHPDDHESEREALAFGQKLGIPVIVRASGACTQLQEGQLVALDPERGVIYSQC
jgi:pyruvate kinase